LKSGTTDFLITGYALAGYSDSAGDSGSFNAAFFPIFLWKLSDQVFFAAEMELELEDDETKTNLEFMEIDIVLNDYITLRAGKFLTPLSTFKEQLHPAWINKLPDQPLYASGGGRLIPTSSVGFQLSGAAPIGTAKITYAGWISNGPKLEATGGKTGQLNFSNFSDVNDDQSFGGRIGFFPIPELELTYAVLWGQVGTDGTGFNDVDALIQVIGLGYVRESDQIGGRVDVRFEYVRSEVEDAIFPPTVAAPPATPAVIPDNVRDGGYAQIAYRPTKQNGILKNIEGVFRWDFLNNPTGSVSGSIDATKAFDEQRYTLGINYWLNSSTVLKAAYQFDNVDDPQGAKSETNRFFMQAAIGF